MALDEVLKPLQDFYSHKLRSNVILLSSAAVASQKGQRLRVMLVQSADRKHVWLV